MIDLSTSWWGRLSVVLAIGCGLGCDPKSNPQTIDSQTNWLRSCRIDAQCGASKCLCGVCTTPCMEDAACADLDGASCVSEKERGAIAQCGGTRPTDAGLCMPRCDDAPCADHQMCVAGVCTPVPTPTAEVVVDTQALHQMLVGFGATVAYGEDEITNHPQKDALYDTLFAELGLDILRLRDRFEHTGDDNLTISRRLIDAAAASLGRNPTLFMTSWSPPPALKANASVECSGNPDTCTLTRNGTGFDYAGFASFIRRSLDAYAAVGVVPDYFGIQNNPNWVPTAAEYGEACRFLPTEGTVTVSVNGVMTPVDYPGFDQAQTATVEALSGLEALPRMLAPETSDFESMADYVPNLDFSEVEALSHHLYGVDPETLDTDALGAIGALAADNARPVFQTEMQSDGFGTTLFIHYTTVIEGASAYVQQTLTDSASGPTANPQTLVGLDTSTFTRQDPYYAFQHYALHTDPGWMRADASSSADGLLASAWLSPTGYELTVVLVNAGTTDIDAKVSLANGGFATSEVTRTVFGASEHAAKLGSLSKEGILTLPPRAVVTIWFTP